MSSVVFVESPAKSKTINKILGKGYSVKASVGHVRDLPKKKIGIDVKKNFEPVYVVIPGKEKVIKELKKAAKDAIKSGGSVYLATDPDREGEAIAWHIAEEINGKSDKVYRIVFNEITERAVKEAIKHPQRIDMNKVDAQQARRILDRLVGYNLSPFLWKKVQRGLSAGRVQSVAVRLVVDREREISAFKKEEYWSITTELEGSKPPKFFAKLSRLNKETEGKGKFLITDEKTATQVADALKTKDFILKKIERKQKKRMPYAPFTTSTLQQTAARELGFTAKKTMMFAQQLYEGVEIKGEGSVGLITYMRTDSLRVASEAQEWAKKFIVKTFGKDYAPEKPPFYKSKASAQDAHEAIRPTYGDKKPEDIKSYLSKEQFSLYRLIWNRFIASQMSPAQLEQTTFIIEAGTASKPYAELRTTGTVVRFNGFMALYSESKEDIEDEEGALLPSLKEGELLKLYGIQPRQHFTQPPPRFSEATLVKTLEEKGIGRPSTYASILSTIQDRKYVQKTEGKFSPTELGVVVNDLLVDKFSDLFNIGFTAAMEDKLDTIEEGKLKWVRAVKDFYKPFIKDLNEAAETTGKVKPEDISTEEICEKCGKPMVIRWGRHGRFLACSGFPECKNAKPLETGAPGEAAQTIDEKCLKCGSPMVIKAGRFGKFIACSNYPECKTTKAISTGVKCPEDSGDLVERRSRRGKVFWSCGNYPKCTFATWYKPIPKKCPLCKADFLLEKRNKSGVTLQCHKKECGFKEEADTSAKTEA